MMKKDIREPNQRTIWQKVRRIGGTVILSMLLAYVTEVLIGHFSTALTFAMPGQYIADRVVAVPPPPNQLSTLGDSILLAFAIDSTCYLILILGLSAITRKLRDKPAKRSRYPQ